MGHGLSLLLPVPTVGTDVTNVVNEVLVFPEQAKPCRDGQYCLNRDTCTDGHGKSPLKCLLDVLNNAKKSVDVCVFTITCHDLAQALLDLHQRNIRVRIISDFSKSKEEESKMQEFANAGIPVILVKGKGYMHHKFAVIDEHLLVNGSFDWTENAVQNNHDTVMVTDEQDLRTSFAKEFERLWRQNAGSILRVNSCPGTAHLASQSQPGHYRATMLRSQFDPSHQESWVSSISQPGLLQPGISFPGGEKVSSTRSFNRVDPV